MVECGSPKSKAAVRFGYPANYLIDWKESFMSRVLSEAAAESVKVLAEKAAPHRLEIMNVLNKKFSFLRQSFVMYFTQNMDKKKDKEEYVATKIAQEKIFRTVKDFMLYEGGGSPNPRLDGLNKLELLLESLNSVVQYLRYIGHTENLDNILAKLGMKLETRDLNSVYPELAEEGVQENIVKLFDSAVAVCKDIASESNMIRIHVYDEIDDSIKYDAKTNKSGIKPSEFDRLTTLEAIRQKSEEQAEKKLETLKDSIGSTIDSKMNTQLIAQTIAG